MKLWTNTMRMQRTEYLYLEGSGKTSNRIWWGNRVLKYQLARQIRESGRRYWRQKAEQRHGGLCCSTWQGWLSASSVKIHLTEVLSKCVLNEQICGKDTMQSSWMVVGVWGAQIWLTSNLLVVEGGLHSTVPSLFSCTCEMTGVGRTVSGNWETVHLREQQASVFFSNQLCWEILRHLFIHTFGLHTLPVQLSLY